MSKRHFMVRRKADKNQAEIVRALRQYGVPVMDLSGCGGGVPDIAVRAKNGDVRFLEVKTEKGTLRPAQIAVAELWPVTVVRTIDEALEAVREQR